MDITADLNDLKDDGATCSGCKRVFPATSLDSTGLCVGCGRKRRLTMDEMVEAQLVKPEGKCVVVKSGDVEWKL
jgi:hypothetical protein